MTSGINVQQIAAVNPNVSGGLWRAPLGTTLPTDTTTALDAAFVSLGYIDDDGVTRKIDRPQTKKYAWGGSLVASLQQSYSVSFTFKLYQIMDGDVLKAVHGDANTTITAATPTTGTLAATTLNATLNTNSAFVMDGFYQLSGIRLALPVARIVEIGPEKYTHKDLAVYDVTMESFPDTNGNFVYQYWDDGVVSA